jgi:hypothetical protein
MLFIRCTEPEGCCLTQIHVDYSTGVDLMLFWIQKRRNPCKSIFRSRKLQEVDKICVHSQIEYLKPVLLQNSSKLVHNLLVKSRLERVGQRTGETSAKHETRLGSIKSRHPVNSTPNINLISNFLASLSISRRDGENPRETGIEN